MHVWSSCNPLPLHMPYVCSTCAHFELYAFVYAANKIAYSNSYMYMYINSEFGWNWTDMGCLFYIKFIRYACSTKKFCSLGTCIHNKKKSKQNDVTSMFSIITRFKTILQMLYLSSICPIWKHSWSFFKYLGSSLCSMNWNRTHPNLALSPSVTLLATLSGILSVNSSFFVWCCSSPFWSSSWTDIATRSGHFR